MPLTGSEPVLRAALKASLLAVDPPIVSEDTPALSAALDSYCDALATTVVAHIIANAVVLTTGTAAAQTGVIT